MSEPPALTDKQLVGGAAGLIQGRDEPVGLLCKRVSHVMLERRGLSSLRGVHAYANARVLFAYDNRLRGAIGAALFGPALAPPGGALALLGALYLENNGLTSIAGIEALPSLRKLFLQGNAIAVVTHHAGRCAQLAELNLSRQRVEPGAGGLAFEEEALAGLASAGAMQVLDVSSCGVTTRTLARLAAHPMRSLVSVSLADNALDSLIAATAFASALPNLERLDVRGNPIANASVTGAGAAYRKAVLEAVALSCPRFCWLDGRDVEPRYREVAAEMRARKGGSLAALAIVATPFQRRPHRLPKTLPAPQQRKASSGAQIGRDLADAPRAPRVSLAPPPLRRSSPAASPKSSPSHSPPPPPALALPPRHDTPGGAGPVPASSAMTPVPSTIRGSDSPSLGDDRNARATGSSAGASFDVSAEADDIGPTELDAVRVGRDDMTPLRSGDGSGPDADDDANVAALADTLTPQGQRRRPPVMGALGLRTPGLPPLHGGALSLISETSAEGRSDESAVASAVVSAAATMVAGGSGAGSEERERLARALAAAAASVGEADEGDIDDDDEGADYVADDPFAETRRAPAALPPLKPTSVRASVQFAPPSAVYGSSISELRSMRPVVGPLMTAYRPMRTPSDFNRTSRFSNSRYVSSQIRDVAERTAAQRILESVGASGAGHHHAPKPLRLAGARPSPSAAVSMPVAAPPITKPGAMGSVTTIAFTGTPAGRLLAPLRAEQAGGASDNDGEGDGAPSGLLNSFGGALALHLMHKRPDPALVSSSMPARLSPRRRR